LIWLVFNYTVWYMLGTSYGCPQLFIRMLNKIMQGITHNSKTNKDTLVCFLHSLVWVNKKHL